MALFRAQKSALLWGWRLIRLPWGGGGNIDCSSKEAAAYDGSLSDIP